MMKFWKWASDNYRQVLIVPGNHEYYNYCDVMERGLQWKWMFRKNVGYYQNQVVRIDATDFHHLPTLRVVAPHHVGSQSDNTEAQN